MKRTTFFAMLLAALCSTSLFTACLGDDDNETKELSDKDKSIILYNLADNYTGRLTFYNPNKLSKVDSIKVNWNIDRYGNFTCEDFPLRFLASYALNLSTERAILEAAENATFTATLTPTQQQSQESGSMVLCLFIPKQMTYKFNIDYEGTTYPVTVQFATSLQRYETGGYTNYAATSEHVDWMLNTSIVRRMTAYILLDKLYINGQEIDMNDYASFIGSRKS